jgi:hypothetical protein
MNIKACHRCVPIEHDDFAQVKNINGSQSLNENLKTNEGHTANSNGRIKQMHEETLARDGLPAHPFSSTQLCEMIQMQKICIRWQALWTVGSVSPKKLKSRQQFLQFHHLFQIPCTFCPAALRARAHHYVNRAAQALQRSSDFQDNNDVREGNECNAIDASENNARHCARTFTPFVMRFKFSNCRMQDGVDTPARSAMS